jgi:hypothetical protein
MHSVGEIVVLGEMVNFIVLLGALAYRVARFFSVTTYQSGENVPNDHKIYPMALK